MTTATTFGGDVSGTYNNIQLGTGVVTGVELEDLIPNPSGTYGNATTVPVITVDINGRVTGVTPTSISFPAETDPVWTAAQSGTTTITGNWTFSNTITGDISGNAGTATALQTARNFSLSGDVTASAVSFNGTSDVTLTTAIANGAVTSAKILDGTIVPADVDLTASGWNFTTLQQGGNNVLTTATTFGGDVSGTYNNIQLGTGVVTGVELEDLIPNPSGTYGNATTVPVITVDINGRVTGVTPTSISFPAETDPVWTAAQSGTTTITGNWTFSNTITGDISGNAGTATALQTARNFSLSGDVTASAVSFNGTSDVTLTTTIANGAVTSAKILDGTIVPADVDLTASGWNFTTLQQGGNNVLTTATTFGGDVSGTYNNIQLGTGVVTGVELEDLIPDPSGTYGNATTVPVITVDINGRVTGVTPDVNIIPSGDRSRVDGSAKRNNNHHWKLDI